MCASNKDLSNDKQKAAGPADAAIPRQIPRGVEVLVKKAVVDPTFKKLLFEKRAEAAEAIGLKLTPAEEAMLTAVPLPQLEGIIAHTRVSPKFREVFLGYAASAMLAVVGSATFAADCAHTEGLPDVSTLRRWKSAPRTYRARPASSLDGPTGDFDAVLNEIGSMPGHRPLSDTPATEVSPENWGLGIRPDVGIKGGARRVRKGVVPHAPPSSISGEGTVSPLRSPKTISRIVRQRLAGIEYVYIKALRENPNLSSGKITVRFVIAADGEVISASPVSDTIGNPALTRGVLNRVMTWRFPPIDAGDVVVIYPFIFVKTGG